MIGACCPGYNELCGRRWNAEQLLSDAGRNADVAFLSAIDAKTVFVILFVSSLFWLVDLLRCCDGGADH